MDENTALSGQLLDPGEQDGLRVLNRSPHPYHHQNADLPHPSERLGIPTSQPFSKESTPISESGTEADDEHILKGLPAPKTKLHKGLRHRDGLPSGTTTPSRSQIFDQTGEGSKRKLSSSQSRQLELAKGNKNLARRLIEIGIVFFLSLFVVTNRQVSPVAKYWRYELERCAALCLGLAALYPLRLIRWAYWNRPRCGWIPIRIPADFDPAPLLYPPAITILVSLLVSPQNQHVMLINIILGLCAIPQQVIPKLEEASNYDSLHWVISCLPLIWGSTSKGQDAVQSQLEPLLVETATLLYPLQRTVCIVLHDLTTTSLLTAELQLLSVALVDILILAQSPQLQILKALLWLGSVCVMLFSGTVIRWGITLARVPRWRFRRPSIGSQKRPLWKSIKKALSWTRGRSDSRMSPLEELLYETPDSDISDDDHVVLKQPARAQTIDPEARRTELEHTDASITRSHTIASPEKVPTSPGRTSAGRKKRATSMSAKPFLKLTHEEAVIRKWAYALYVYSSIVLIILVGVREYVHRVALRGYEPVGWALGYLFGGIPWFRFQVVHANLENWICLPPLLDPTEQTAAVGWVEHLRLYEFGEANSRLLLSGYWLVVILCGLLVVFQLQGTYEVDTRRKIFHFMMVGMFIPALYVDPTYAALALGLILAIFLILDLLRASQLPPLSKPIASFLAPYVDGRDFRGPVVISHIFLLIGCAIPLWLALGALPRTGLGALAGWDVQTRDVSMLAGVICVGLGDAAASLIGRRWGHRKWFWGGGKSLEGSVAFAVAVSIGLTVAAAWLHIGGWTATQESLGVVATVRNAAVCGSIASLTEAVLTGGNDNVVVPVMLWTCVKSLAI